MSGILLPFFSTWSVFLSRWIAGLCRLLNARIDTVENDGLRRRVFPTWHFRCRVPRWRFARQIQVIWKKEVKMILYFDLSSSWNIKRFFVGIQQLSSAHGIGTDLGLDSDGGRDGTECHCLSGTARNPQTRPLEQPSTSCKNIKLLLLNPGNFYYFFFSKHTQK